MNIAIVAVARYPRYVHTHADSSSISRMRTNLADGSPCVARGQVCLLQAAPEGMLLRRKAAVNVAHLGNLVPFKLRLFKVVGASSPCLQACVSRPQDFLLTTLECTSYIYACMLEPLCHVICVCMLEPCMYVLRTFLFRHIYTSAFIDPVHAR